MKFAFSFFLLIYSRVARRLLGPHDTLPCVLISKCSYNLFLVVERTNRISLASFTDLQCHARDQLCCLSGVVFKKLCDQTISKCLYNLFLAVERTHRVSLAGFSDLQCVVYVPFFKQILHISVLYLPKCTVFAQLAA